MKDSNTAPQSKLYAIELVALPQNFYVSRERLGTCNTVPLGSLRYQQSALFIDPAEAEQIADALNDVGEGDEWKVLDVTDALYPASSNASTAKG